MAEITGQNAWSLVRKSAQVGERLNTWSVARGNLGTSFVIQEVNDDGLKVSLDGTGAVRTLSSSAFDRLGAAWNDYVAGKVRRYELLKLSHNTSYELPLLKAGLRFMSERLTFDGPVILGAGLAGLTAALAAGKALVLSPTPLATGCSSAWAQGGMAAALAGDDSPELHAADTIAAGAGLCDPKAVELLTREGPQAVRDLAALGAPFDRKPPFEGKNGGEFVLSLEAAHAKARVARVGGDGAGAAIMAAVIASVRATPSIEVRENARARRLLQDKTGRVVGVLAQIEEELVEIRAHSVILATGGVGGLYAVTTTPAQVRGEGLGLAALAGATIADPEFVQFHPTAIDIGRDPAPLATEALRGEGSILRNTDGRAFMADYHPAKELAPRDVVARAIHAERAAGRGAFLDATTAVGAHFPHEFPAVFEACRSGGIDPRREMIPVVPAVHYHMGGVATDLDGRASLPGLYAAGECASTGVQGANRLASNSLLEAAVFGARAGHAAATDGPDGGQAGGEPVSLEPLPDLPDETLQVLRRAMSRDAGVIRDAAGLTRLLEQIDALEPAYGPCPPLVAARLIVDAALARHESRGGHYRSDFPATAEAVRTFVTPTSADLAVRYAAE